MDNQTIGLLSIVAACLLLLAWAISSGPSSVTPVVETPATVEEEGFAPSNEKDTNTIIREQLGAQ